MKVSYDGGKRRNSANWFEFSNGEGFSLIEEKGSIRYYAKAGHPHLIRVDFHGAKEVPTGTVPRNFESGRTETKMKR